MTTATQAPPTIKFTGLSPLTTALVRQRTQLLQNLGTIRVGRTILTFRMETTELDDLFDKLIQTEIPGSGANSKEVSRLRQLRRDLRITTAPRRPDYEEASVSKVTVTRGYVESESDRIRDELIDIFYRYWERGMDSELDYELDALIDDPKAPRRDWLADHL